MSIAERSRYHSYLLRLWRPSPEEPWRASLQSVRSGQIHHFATAEEAWAYLQARMRDAAEESQRQQSSRQSRGGT